MPEEDVSDLRDVVDAINRLCENMKTSSYEEPIEETQNEIPTNAIQYVGSHLNIKTLSYQEPIEDTQNEIPTNTVHYVGFHENMVTSSYEEPIENTQNEIPTNTVQYAGFHENMVTSSYEEPIENTQNEIPTNTVQYAGFHENMEPSSYEEPIEDTQNEIAINTVHYVECSNEIETDVNVQYVEYRDIELVGPEEVSVQRVEVYNAEKWSDSTSQISPPGQCEPISEMYYTASSEISLLSDTEVPEKQNEDEEVKDDRKRVIAGHVAAMRERFESMTRTNTPCPDMIRSLSPSLEVFRNMSPSPDRLA